MPSSHSKGFNTSICVPSKLSYTSKSREFPKRNNGVVGASFEMLFSLRVSSIYLWIPLSLKCLLSVPLSMLTSLTSSWLLRSCWISNEPTRHLIWIYPNFSCFTHVFYLLHSFYEFMFQFCNGDVLFGLRWRLASYCGILQYRLFACRAVYLHP